MNRKKGISLKTFLFSFVLMMFITLFTFAVFYFILPDYYETVKKSNFEKNTNTLVSELNFLHDPVACANIISEFSSKNNANVIPLDESGKVLVDFTTTMLTANQLRNEFFTVTVQREEEIFSDSKNVEITEMEPMESGLVLESSLPLFFQREVTDSLIHFVVVSGSLQPVDEVKLIMLGLIPYIVIGGTIVSFVFSLWFSRKLTKPILSLSNTAWQMQQLDPKVLATVNSNDELGELSNYLNTLYQKLMANIKGLKIETEKAQKLERSKADFMRAAGHELKTPVSAINGILEGMIDSIGEYKNRDKYLLVCKEQVDRLSKLIQDILRASADDTALLSIEEEVDIRKLIHSIMSDYNIFIYEKELQVKLEEFSFYYETNSNLFKTVLSNLISNAVMYTPRDGHIFIGFKNNILTIENSCNPIPENELNRLFEAFYTMDYSRNRLTSGTGLGLYIVKRYLETLGLCYKIENSNLGLKFSIIFNQTKI